MVREEGYLVLGTAFTTHWLVEKENLTKLTSRIPFFFVKKTHSIYAHQKDPLKNTKHLCLSLELGITCNVLVVLPHNLVNVEFW